MQPGAQAGCEWAPAAYSPRTGYFYTHARYQPTILTSHPGNIGTPGTTSKDEGSTEVPHIPGVRYFGQFDAINTRTGRIAWTIHTPQLPLSGVAVGGNLIFYGEENGRFHAADAATGRVLWTFDGTSIQHGGGSTFAPAVYMVHGREYVVDAFGGNAADRMERKQYDPAGDAITAFPAVLSAVARAGDSVSGAPRGLPLPRGTAGDSPAAAQLTAASPVPLETGLWVVSSLSLKLRRLVCAH